MDPRVALLKEFSGTFVSWKAKIETEKFGFLYLEELLSDGVTLEYGELINTRLLHKYKIVGVHENRMDDLLHMHIMKECNVCRYFGSDKSDVLCFNMDNNHKTNNTIIIPEMKLALDALRSCLQDLGCEALTIASGRGYHVWLRLDEPVENELLHGFMLRAAVHSLLPLRIQGYDHHTVKFSFYPDTRVNDVVSLRLFGSDHAKNKVFSHVLAPEGLLDETASWKYFEDFVRNKAMSATKFRAAFDDLMKK